MSILFPHTIPFLTLVAAIVVLPGSAVAELEIRAGGALVYDGRQNLTWLADANYAATTGYDPHGVVPGYMDYHTAKSWVTNLQFAGFNDWRLPYTVQPDPSCSVQTPGGVSTSYGCVNSELERMFYINLGGVSLSTISEQHNENFMLFHNINDEAGYYWF